MLRWVLGWFRSDSSVAVVQPRLVAAPLAVQKTLPEAPSPQRVLVAEPKPADIFGPEQDAFEAAFYGLDDDFGTLLRSRRRSATSIGKANEARAEFRSSE